MHGCKWQVNLGHCVACDALFGKIGTKGLSPVKSLLHTTAKCELSFTMGFFEKCFLRHLYDSAFALVCYKREKFTVLHLIKLFIKNSLFALLENTKNGSLDTACMY